MAPARAWLGFGLVPVVAVAVLLVAGAVSAQCAMSARVAYGIAFVVVASELLAAARLVPRAPGWVTALLVAASAGALWAVRGAAPSLAPASVVTVALLTGGSALGGAVGQRIDKPGHLLAVFAISALADFWSVYDPAGPSARLARQAATQPDTLVLFALPWPILGSGRIEAIIGAGDLLFAALYSAALRRHGVHGNRATLAMAGGLMVGLALLFWLERALPLLPFLGAAVVVAEPRARSLPVADRRSVATVVGVLTVILIYRFTR